MSTANDPASAFPADIISGLRDDEEIQIQSGSDPRMVIIWSVVVDGIPYIRSFRGPTARWYRDVVADGQCTVHVGGRRAPARARAVTDPATIAAVSEALLAKYPSDPATPQMVAPGVLETTLRLEPD